MESSWELIKLRKSYSEKLSHTSLSDIRPVKLSENSFTKEDSAKLAIKEFPYHQTPSSKRASERVVSARSKIWSMRFTLLDLTSKLPTISCGHSSCEHQEEASRTRDTHFKEEEIGEIESNSSINSSQKCCDHSHYLNHPNYSINPCSLIITPRNF